MQITRAVVLSIEVAAVKPQAAPTQLQLAQSSPETDSYINHQKQVNLHEKAANQIASATSVHMGKTISIKQVLLYLVLRPVKESKMRFFNSDCYGHEEIT